MSFLFLILLPHSKVVAVRRGHDVTGVASVEYKTFEMTATAGEDFKPAQGQLIFPSGVLEQVRTIGENKCIYLLSSL